MVEERLIPTNVINQFNLGAEITGIFNSSYSNSDSQWHYIDFYYTDYLNNEVKISNLYLSYGGKFVFNIYDDIQQVNKKYYLKFVIEEPKIIQTPSIENWGSFLYIGTNNVNNELIFDKTNVENIDIYNDYISQHSITIQEPEQITDLTDTVWYLKENIILDNLGTYKINFASKGKQYSTITLNSDTIYFHDISHWSTVYDRRRVQSWTGGYRLIIIKDGEDVKNPDFINWIVRNGVRTEVKVQIEGAFSFSDTTLYNSILQLKPVLTEEKENIFPVFNRFRWGDGDEAWHFNYLLQMPKNSTDNEITYSVDFTSGANREAFDGIKIVRRTGALSYESNVGDLYYLSGQEEKQVCRTYVTIESGHYVLISNWEKGYTDIAIAPGSYSDEFNEWLKQNATLGATGSMKKSNSTRINAVNEFGFDPYATFIKVLFLQNIE